MTIEAVSRPTVVLAPDRPGHWYDNGALLSALTVTIGARSLAICGDRCVWVRMPADNQHWTVSPSHEDGFVGLAASQFGRVGFDLCHPGRVRSVRSALALAMSLTERPLVDPATCPPSLAVGVWTAIEAVAKCTGVGVFPASRRPQLSSVDPPMVQGIALHVRWYAGLVGCLACAVPEGLGVR